MSKIKLTGHASGSGVLTIAAPNTDTDRTITLPDVTGTLLDSGSTLDATKLTGALPAISGANLTGISSVGGATGVDFNDNVKARFGTGNDLEIYHDGSDSIVQDSGTGNLLLMSDGAGVYIQKGTSETMAQFVVDGAAKLYYDNAKKIETTSTGINVTGAITVDGSPLAGGSAIPSGTVMAFFQSGAPTGWTKVTSQNDKLLRVVSGTGGGTGGSAAASSPSHNLSAGNHTLSTNEIPAHNHSSRYSNAGSGSNLPNYQNRQLWNNDIYASTNNTGGGGGHSHSMSGSITTPQYIDVILCSYDG